MASSANSSKSGIKLLCILIGIPASGKSTFIQSFKTYLESTQSRVKFICVEFDSFLPRDARCQPGDPSDGIFLWKKHRELLEKRIDVFLDCPFELCPDKLFSDALLPQINADIDGKVPVLVLDDTFHYRSMRYQYYRLARKHGASFLQIYFDTCLEECIARNKTREHRVPEQTITNVHKQMSNPMGSIFKWEHGTIQIDTGKDFNFDELVTRIQEASLKPAPPLVDMAKTLSSKETARNQTNANIAHQCDIVLRKLVGNFVKQENAKGLGKQSMKLFAEKCNLKRIEVLNVLSEEMWEDGTKPSDIEPFVIQLMKEAMLDAT